MSDDVEAVERVARAWEEAIVANDVEAIRRCAARDWVIVGPDGVGTAQDFERLVGGGELTHSAMDTADGTVRIRIHGDTAVRTARVTNTAHHGGRTFTADEWTTDVYVRGDDGWVCVLSHITPAGPA